MRKVAPGHLAEYLHALFTLYGFFICKNLPIGLFGGRLNSDQDCELFLANGFVDHEENESFEVDVRLDTLSAYANPKMMKTKVLIKVVDENDNVPSFVYDDEVNQLVKDQYLTAIPDTTPIDQLIFKVKATDSDSGPYGELEYSITGDRLAKEYFAIDSRSGEIRDGIHQIPLRTWIRIS